MSAEALLGATREVGRSEAGARLATLDPAARYATVISTYEVAPERADELLELLAHATDKILRYVSGFVSGNLHLSFDRTRVVNYTQWRSREAIRSARNHPSVAALLGEAREIAECWAPIACELRLSTPAARTSCSGADPP